MADREAFREWLDRYSRAHQVGLAVRPGFDVDPLRMVARGLEREAKCLPRREGCRIARLPPQENDLHRRFELGPCRARTLRKSSRIGENLLEKAIRLTLR